MGKGGTHISNGSATETLPVFWETMLKGWPLHRRGLKAGRRENDAGTTSRHSTTIGMRATNAVAFRFVR